MSGQMEQLKMGLEVPQTEIPKIETNSVSESFEEARARISKETGAIEEVINQRDGEWYVGNLKLAAYKELWQDDSDRNNPYTKAA
ncbi:MAG: hypothetical protein WCO58_01485 [bacterium]